MCGVTVRPGELEAHYVHELDRLYKLSALGKTGSHRRLYAKVPRPAPGVLARVPGVEGTSDGRYDVSIRRVRSPVEAPPPRGWPVLSVADLPEDKGEPPEPPADQEQEAEGGRGDVPGVQRARAGQRRGA